MSAAHEDDTVTLVTKFARNIGFLAAGALTALTALYFILLAIAFLIRGQLVSHDMDESTATFLALRGKSFAKPKTKQPPRPGKKG